MCKVIRMTTATATAAKETRVRGRPFVRGQCGNPGGRYVKSARYLELHAQIMADFGDDLTGLERALVDQVVALLVRSERTSNIGNAVRAANTAARLLARIGHKARSQSEQTLDDYLNSRDEASGGAQDDD